jgi:rare lipoprotein A
MKRRLAAFASLLTLVFVYGCGARNSATNRTQAPPLQPSSTPVEADASSKNDTSSESAKPQPPAGAASSPAPGKRRDSDVNPAAAEYTEEGNASWYGAPFHGRRASNGEIYDMNKMTAAHRTLPFNTMVRVTNLNNGKSTVVRITDRGPFVNNRVIDLSFAAAKAIESVGPGIVPVRLEILSAIDPTAGFFTVQVGAFRDRANAERLRDRLSLSYSPVSIQEFEVADGTFYRVRVGKVSGEPAARRFGDQLRDHEGFTPIVVRLDDEQ